MLIMMYKGIMEFKVRELDIFYRMSGWLKKSDVVSSKSALPSPLFWSLSDSVMYAKFVTYQCSGDCMDFNRR